MSIASIVRARDWWDYKIPPLLAAAYVLLALTDVPFSVGARAIALFLVFLVGTASFGYFLNDLCDIRADRAAGKDNRAARLRPAGRAAVLLATLTLVAAPWALLPTPPQILGLVGLELALFVAYAVPPLRLKSRGASALVADALYAHTIPMLIAVLTFASLAPEAVPGTAGTVALVAGWSFLTGFRGILLHQVDDLSADRRAGVRTAVSHASRLGAVSLVTFVVMPLEVGLGAALTVRLGADLPHFPVITAVVLVVLAIRARRVFGPLSQPPAPGHAGDRAWRLQDELGGHASMELIEGGVRIAPGADATSEAWKIRLRSRPVMVRAGQAHRLRFRARADGARPLEFALTETDEPWGTLGPYRRVDLTQEPLELVTDIPAPTTNRTVCVQVNLAGASETVEMTGVSLVRESDGRDVLVPSDDEPLAVDRSALGRRRRFADFYGSGVLNDCYERWLPLYPLALLSLRDPLYWFLALAHVLAFRTLVRR